MAPGRQGPRVRRKENDAGNRRFSITSSEDVPVPGASVPFEELLARELRKSEGNGAKSAAVPSGKAGKKPFLKRGARGWWMRQPGAKQKVVKHTLTSKGEDEEESTARTRRVGQRSQKQQTRWRRSSSASSADTLSPVTTPPEQQRTVSVPPKTLSPPVSPIRRMQFSNQDGLEDAEAERRRQQHEELAAWKNASFRSTTSTDIMGMKNVRQSYEAKQEREANEMAEFEAIERDLAAEKEAYLMEKKQQYQQPTQPGRQDVVRDNRNDHWGLPYSSFVSELHEQEQSRWQTTRSGSIFDDSLDEDADSALVFDDHGSLPKDDWLSERDGFTSQLRDHFGYGNNYGDPPSDLSAVSFDDSVPWDDGLSFQPRQSLAHDQPSGVGTPRNDPFGVAPNATTEQPASTRQVYFAGDDSTDDHGYNNPGPVPDTDAPVSSLVQHVFGEYDRSGDNNSIIPEDDSNSIASGVDNNINNNEPVRSKAASPPPPAQDRSLSTLKQKLRGKQKTPTRIPTTNKAKNSSARAAAGPPRAPAKQKPGATTGKQTQLRGRAAQPADSGMILPSVIEEKLYELEEEVKFYKSETLQLQKRKDHYEQEVKKLALERDEFTRYQQEQRVLIEKEWERERAKMKKEEKLQERQWKLRMNATISHQDRKDRGEVETLKAQIVKMQLDEKAQANKWKAVNENLRQRVTELEGKNRELSDEIKFLEKDRLEQWEKYERLLKNKQDASHLGSKAKATADFSHALGVSGELRTMDDVFAISGTADELLHRWSLPHSGSPQKERDDQDHPFTANSGYRHREGTATAEDYNPKRYSLDREDAHFSIQPGASTDASDVNNERANGIGGDADNTRSNGVYEWALPAAEDDTQDVYYSDQNPADGDGDISALMSSLPAHKIVSREVEHAGGKKEVIYTDGSRKVLFPDGNEKEIDASGHVVIKFTNGDHKELFPDTGVSVYYYYEAQTKLTTYPDNRKVYEFPNQQIETSLPDGTTEIQFADGIKKTIHPNGDEFSVFPDGTTMLEQPDGLREVTLLNQKKIRYFPDGQMACVAPGGQETRVRSDSELKQLMESS